MSHGLLVACCLLSLGACVFPGSVEPTVKIGLSAPFEGLYRDLGYEVLHAVRLAVRQRNDAGGVDGRYLVELVALNDLNEAEEAVQQAREMAVDPGVLGVLGGWSPLTAQGAAAEYNDLGLAFVAPDWDPQALAQAAADVAVGERHLRRGVVLHGVTSAEVALGAAFAQAFSARGGSLGFVGTPAGDDWPQRLMQEGAPAPDLVFVAADVTTAAGWIVALRDAGYTGTLLGGPQVGSPLLVDMAGAASDGLLFVSPFPPTTPDPGFVEAYQALSGGAPPGPAAGWAYQAANRLLDAIGEASAGTGQPDRIGVRRMINEATIGTQTPHLYVINKGKIVVND